MKDALLWLELSLQDQRMSVPQNYDGFVEHPSFPQDGKKCGAHPRGGCHKSVRHLGE